ncbi:MAG: histidine--tRNA ligase [Acidimicrobiales bacterium MED-G01]|nr:MAG: histidine--tRNA ligase [Acidimicrobiales bacterium MED-G01]|tara:strand:- start:1487 stop:2764 length:1278 start_codon:yes stop_codon:yes gene_type:complete
MSKKANTFQTPIGTRDLLPGESARWEAVIEVFSSVASRAGFSLIDTPIFEDIGVFSRIGEGTDVVGKEMYEFLDRGERPMALRPEGTAAVCRAFAQHRPPTPWKVYYRGPYFRYEAPQAGRFRQFHQFGIESIGSDDPDIDAEVIAVGWNVLQNVGLKKVDLLVNSMGDLETRKNYQEALGTFLKDHSDDLDEEDQIKVGSHPLRVLDSKRPATQSVTANAPRVNDFLTAGAQEHFDRVKDGLTALNIPFSVEPRLVRGLDYYTHTTFEFQSLALENAQNAVCGGGRYNGLIEELGGPPTPGIGFGMGIERLLMACDAEESFPVPSSRVQVWVVDVTDGSPARDLTHELRNIGVVADRSFDQRSMRSQMRSANRSGAEIALIIGDQEVSEETVAIRMLRDEESEQIVVPRNEAVAEVRSLLGLDS